MENSLQKLAAWYCSLAECAAVLEPISLRTLQSWASGQTLRIKPSRGRGRYGLWSLLQFSIAALLLKTGLPAKGIQVFIDRFADADFLPETFAQKMKGRFIVSESPSDREHVDLYFFSDEEKFWVAVKTLADQTPLRFTTLHLDTILHEVLSRIAAWQQRREYVAQSHGDGIAKALNSLREFNLEHGLPRSSTREYRLAHGLPAETPANKD